MNGNARQTGGLSNKRGNEYEDIFVTFRLIEYAPLVVRGGAVVCVKEQAGCPVDDLVLQEPQKTHYHQLKTSPTITWTAEAEKLLREFREQLALCQSRNEAHALWLVVAEEHRARLLREATPDDLCEAATVFHFPLLQRPSQLAGLRQLLGNAFDQLRASRFPSRTEDEALAGAVFLAFVEQEPDAEGFVSLEAVLDAVRVRALARICWKGSIAHAEWPRAQTFLSQIQELEYWTDRGHFEWRYRLDAGLIGPVDGATFHRFVDRIVSGQPKTFEDFERLLP